MTFLTYLVAICFLWFLFLASAYIILEFLKNWDAGQYPELKPRKKKHEPKNGPIIGENPFTKH